MKKLAAFLLIAACATTACKKEKQNIIDEDDPVQPHPASVHTQKLGKVWVCEGIYEYAQHPSNMDSTLTYSHTDTFTNYKLDIQVIDDTTIYLMNERYSFYTLGNVHQTVKYISEKLKKMNTSGNGSGLTYYYAADSIRFVSSDGGVSFHRILDLHSK